MKTFSLLLLGLVWSATHSPGQTSLSPHDGALVDCGQEKVVAAEGTFSKDNHFAAAWTIHPQADKPLVDWSVYERDNPLALVDRYGVNSNPSAGPGKENDAAGSGYLLINGVVDLTAKRFMPLATEDPWFPGKTRAALRTVWSADRHGMCYGAIGNTVGSKYTEGNVDLWLVELSAGGMNVVNLKPGADEAVQAFLHRRDPKDAERYQWSFTFDDLDAKAGRLTTGFKGDVLALRFIATVPDKTDDLDVGFVQFRLPKGEVRGAVADAAGRRRFFP